MKKDSKRGGDILWHGKANLPLYSTPEFSLTVIGAPMISDKKPEGSLLASGVLASAPPAGEDVSIW